MNIKNVWMDIMESDQRGWLIVDVNTTVCLHSPMSLNNMLDCRDEIYEADEC